MLKLVKNLLFRIAVAIILGIVIGIYCPEWINRILLTFNKLFGSFLGFSIPLIILGLVMPAISELGKSAGKLLFITIVIAYGSILFSGFSTYFITNEVFPSLLLEENLGSVGNISKELKPYFTIEIQPILGVMSALVLAFMIGIGLSFKKNSTLGEIIIDFREIIVLVIEKILIPLLPLYILSIFAEIVFNGQVSSVLSVFIKIIGIIFVLQIALLIFQYLIAGFISRKNPFKAMATMFPAYVTALGTQSSSATIPITLQQTLNNGVSVRIAGFVIPLCATIHLSGSTMKITACALALMILNQTPYDFELFAGFIMMLGVIMVAQCQGFQEELLW